MGKEEPHTYLLSKQLACPHTASGLRAKREEENKKRLQKELRLIHTSSTSFVKVKRLLRASDFNLSFRKSES